MHQAEITTNCGTPKRNNGALPGFTETTNPPKLQHKLQHCRPTIYTCLLVENHDLLVLRQSQRLQREQAPPVPVPMPATATVATAASPPRADHRDRLLHEPPSSPPRGRGRFAREHPAGVSACTQGRVRTGERPARWFLLLVLPLFCSCNHKSGGPSSVFGRCNLSCNHKAVV